MEDKRDIFIQRLKEDLIGPLKKDEILKKGHPESTYLNGILYPSSIDEQDEQDDETDPIVKDSDTYDEIKDKVSNNKIRKPSSMGLSFCLDPKKNKNLELEIKINLGIYKPEAQENNNENKNTVSSIQWRRKEINHNQKINLSKNNDWVTLNNDDLKKLEIWYEKKRLNNLDHITLVLVNRNPWVPRKLGGSDTKTEQIERSFFQTRFQLYAKSGFEPRPFSNYNPEDEDEKIYELIYRNNKDYCSGFNCSSDWVEKNNIVEVIKAEWLIKKNIYSVSPEGDKDFFNGSNELTTKSFAKDNINVIKKKLTDLIKGYQKWIEHEQKKIGNLNQNLQDQAKKNISVCNLALKRMEEGLDKLFKDKNILEAFRFANATIEKQYSWKDNSGFQFSWRPFQLGFFLLNLDSITDQNSKDRDFFDLLWFPTGGGKTEAYLFISIFLIFYSRLNKNFHNTKGTQIIMRYTLRAVTIDQFTRISATICAAEILRKENHKIFGDQEITLGLWVGRKQTPNWFYDVKK